MPLGGYRGAGGTGRVVSRKQYKTCEFKSGFESREIRRSTQQVAVSSKSGAVVLNDRLANDVCRNGTHSSRTDDDRVMRALVRNEMCWFRYCGYDVC